MKTHYAYIESQANESYNETIWSDALCGVDSISVNTMPVSDNWKYVDCKKCLKLKEAYQREMKRAMEHNIRDMAGFVAFMEKEKKIN